MPINAPAFDPNQPFDVIGGQQGAPSPAPSQNLEDFDWDSVNSNLKGTDYLHQFPPEVQAATSAFMTGDVMPTGNPRNNQIGTLAKTVAQKLAMDAGDPNLASDTLYSQRRKMRTDLGSSTPNSLGGILSNGQSAFMHLSELSDKYAGLGNSSGPSFIPGSGRLGQAYNELTNNILPSAQTLGQVKAINDNALKYGQEATKFYAGTGGGEAERMSALNGINPNSATPEEMASFLETEKGLMLDRLGQKVEQIRGTLGDQYLAKNPVVTPQVQAAIAKIDGNIALLRGGAPQRPQLQTAAPSGLPAGWSVQVH